MTVAVFGMDLAQPPQVEVEHLAVEPLRFGQLPTLVEQDGQVVHRRRGLEMVGAEHLHAACRARAARWESPRCCGRATRRMDCRPSRSLAISACSAPYRASCSASAFTLERLGLVVASRGSRAPSPGPAASCRPRRDPARRAFRRIARTSRCNRSASSGRPLSCQSRASSAIAFGRRLRVSSRASPRAAPARARGAAARDRRRRARGRCGRAAASCRPGPRAGRPARSRCGVAPRLRRSSAVTSAALARAGSATAKRLERKRLTSRALAASRRRDPRLPGHPDEPADERQQHQRGRRHADGVAPHELARAISNRIPPRGDGQARLIPANVLDQRARRRDTGAPVPSAAPCMTIVSRSPRSWRRRRWRSVPRAWRSFGRNLTVGDVVRAGLASGPSRRPRPTADDGRTMSRSVTARSTSAAVRRDS